MTIEAVGWRNSVRNTARTLVRRVVRRARGWSSIAESSPSPSAPLTFGTIDDVVQEESARAGCIHLQSVEGNSTDNWLSGKHVGELKSLTTRGMCGSGIHCKIIPSTYTSRPVIIVCKSLLICLLHSWQYFCNLWWNTELDFEKFLPGRAWLLHSPYPYLYLFYLWL